MKHLMTCFIVVSVLASAALADPLSQAIAGSVNARLSDNNGDGVFTETVVPLPSGTLSVRKFQTIPLDERSVIEFDVSNCPDQQLTSASFDYKPMGYTSPSAPVIIYGYVGNGSAELADATTTGVLLGSYLPDDLELDEQSVPLDVQSVLLDVDLLDSLLDGASYVGLRLQAGGASVNTQIAGVATIYGLEPTLQLEFVPEPGMLCLLAFGSLSLLAKRRSGRK